MATGEKVRKRSAFDPPVKEHAMATIHLHQTTTATPEQFVAGLTDFGPGRLKLFGNSADEYLEVHDQGPRSRRRHRARAASGNACATTGPIPTASS
jgi:hypothetical protein